MRASKSRRPAIAQAIRASLLHETEIRLIGYWGVGRRAAILDYEKATVQYLGHLLRELTKACETLVKANFLLTDTHALLNGYQPDKIRKYCSSTSDLLKAAGIGTETMSDFLLSVDQWDTAKSVINHGAVPSLSWLISGGKLRELVRLAQLRAGRADSEDAALRYYLLNQIEGVSVASRFSGSLFLAYAAPGMDFLLPAALPKVHIWSRWSGDSRRPWFME